VGAVLVVDGVVVQEQVAAGSDLNIGAGHGAFIARDLDRMFHGEVQSVEGGGGVQTRRNAFYALVEEGHTFVGALKGEGLSSAQGEGGCIGAHPYVFVHLPDQEILRVCALDRDLSGRLTRDPPVAEIAAKAPVGQRHHAHAADLVEFGLLIGDAVVFFVHKGQAIGAERRSQTAGQQMEHPDRAVFELKQLGVPVGTFESIPLFDDKT